PADWDWFRLAGVRYHGHDLDVVWDRTGAKFGRGRGLSVWVDGAEIARAAALGPLEGLSVK
ncbi:MAG: glycoside hydrolase, partial [bacterium]|nr:glycoside hydrolase [bacterium]